MSLQSWATPTDLSDECQKACEEASAMVQQLSRSELQNLVDDTEAFNRLISDMEKVMNYDHPLFVIYLTLITCDSMLLLSVIFRCFSFYVFLVCNSVLHV